MKHTIRHGVSIDIPSVGEITAAVKAAGPATEGKALPYQTHIRAREVLNLSGSPLTLDIYTVPSGFWFEVHRVSFILPEASAVSFSVTDAFWYLRSGEMIGIANPDCPVLNTPGVPGVESWGAQQGPILRNGETFSVQADTTLTESVTIEVQGSLFDPEGKR